MKKSAAAKNAGTLYVVATPIGNYDDITLRALNALQECDVIVCEESKEALRLLKHYEIEKEIMELNEHNDTESSVECMKLLTQGKKLALISDAGTPLLADPGDILVKTAVKYKIDVKVLPGASSVLTALVRSTLNSKQFVYAGFLNRKNEARDAEIQMLAREPRTIVLMDTPYRLKTILSALAAAMPERQAYVGCNLTMTNEAHHYGSLTELEEFFEEHKFRGEYVIVIEGSSEPFEYVAESAQTSAQAPSAMQEEMMDEENLAEASEEPQRGRGARKTRVVQSADFDPMDDVDALPLPESEDDAHVEVSVDDYEPVLADQNQGRSTEGSDDREHGQRDRNWNNGGRRWNNNYNNKRRWDNNRRYNQGDRRDSGATRTENNESYTPANANNGGSNNNGGNGYRQNGGRNNHGGGRDGQRRGNYRQNRGGNYRYNNNNNNNYRDNQRDQVPNDQFAGPNTSNSNQTNTYYDESYDRRENFGNREGANYSRFDQTLQRDQFGNRGNFNRGRGNRGNYNRGNSGNDGNRRSDAAGFGQYNDYPPKRRKW